MKEKPRTNGHLLTISASILYNNISFYTFFVLNKHQTISRIAQMGYFCAKPERKKFFVETF